MTGTPPIDALDSPSVREQTWVKMGLGHAGHPTCLFQSTKLLRLPEHWGCWGDESMLQRDLPRNGWEKIKSMHPIDICPWKGC